MRNSENRNSWGGQRNCAGRKKTCQNRVPFNRRINEDILNILRNYALVHGITETEALECAILMQSNFEILTRGEIMKIVIPTKDEKLCAHFGHCESFSFVDVNLETKEILNIETKIPDEGISCQSAAWIASQGANIVLAGGMGGRPLNIFAQTGVQVVAGCPELPIKEVIQGFLNQNLTVGENACGGGHHHCGGHEHGEHHHCGHHH